MIKQTIKFNSPNRYFGGFLQNLINQSEITGSVTQTNNELTLLLDNSDEKKVVEFNELVSKYLPHSIFLDEINTAQTNEEINNKKFTSPTYNIAPCNKCIELLTVPSSPEYLNESLKCTHYSNENEESFEDYTIFSPHYSEGSSILITDSSKINDLFIITEDEVKTLFSIEKPTIKVTIKDETLKELTKKQFINIKAPYNNRSALAALNAKEAEVNYMFFHSTGDLNMVVVQKNHTIIKANRVATKLEDLDKDPQINRFLNIAKEANFTKEAIGANLSTNGINFIVTNELGSKKVINFQNFKLESFFFGLHNDTIKNKLLGNFYDKYPHIEDKLSNTLEMGLFELVCLLLDIENKNSQENTAFEELCNKSFEFRGNGGLKIDMHFNSEGFDYVSMLSSIMSFRLAGADTHYIAYSIFEAFGDMAISTLNQLKEKFKCDNIIMQGDLFANSVLYSRILSKYQLANPYFPKAIALDE